MITQLKNVFVLNSQDGMDLLVLKSKNVLMVKNGTSLNLNVFAQLEHIGMELTVQGKIFVQEVKS